jgi:hypothetical protein
MQVAAAALPLKAFSLAPTAGVSMAYGSLAPFNKDTSHIQLGPPNSNRTLGGLITSVRTASKHGHTLRSWGIRTQSEDTNQPIIYSVLSDGTPKHIPLFAVSIFLFLVSLSPKWSFLSFPFLLYQNPNPSFQAPVQTTSSRQSSFNFPPDTVSASLSSQIFS